MLIQSLIFIAFVYNLFLQIENLQKKFIIIISDNIKIISIIKAFIHR
jgi:hypothetical protein